MDKETLSNYGWIVICVLVLAVMLALASPFGKFIATAVQSTTQGLFGVNQEALGATGIDIPGNEFDNTNGGASGGNAGGGYVYAEYTGGIDTTTDHGTLTWEQLAADSADGSYATKYEVGQTLSLPNANGTAVKYRIVGINHDDLADGTGKAHLTLINEKIFTKHNMNATNTNAGGWASSDMRTYLQGEFMNKYIPSTALSVIKTVSKTSFDYDTQAAQTTADNVWIPSYTEVGFTATTITSVEGGSAYAYFTSDASRIRTDNISFASVWWWLRSTATVSSSYFNCVDLYGADNGDGPTNSRGVVFGFCI